VSLDVRQPIRRCGKPYDTEEDAARSKRAQLPGATVSECWISICGAYHVQLPHAERKPLPQVSKKRAAEIRQRRAMLQAKYPGIVLCEVPFCNRVAVDPHEPLTRARGGSITDPENVRAVCRPHHDEVTFEEPDWAYELGFLVHSWDGAA
jgi:hypothetical protein